MFQSKSGKKFGSAYVGKRHDAEHDKAMSVLGEGPEHEAKETPEFEKGEQEGAKEAPEQNEQPSQVVAQHGKAHTIHVAHDHKGKRHHVVSTHADGHVHTSDHASAKEAHDAASQLSGGDQAPAPNAEMGGETAPAQSLPRLA